MMAADHCPVSICGKYPAGTFPNIQLRRVDAPLELKKRHLVDMMAAPDTAGAMQPATVPPRAVRQTSYNPSELRR